MGDILDLSERYWRGEIPPREMWRPTGKSEELAAGVHFFHAWANVTAIRTEAGLVLVDTAEPNNARVHAARATIYEARAGISDALMTRGIFDSTARESAAKAIRSPADAPGPPPGPGERQP